MSTLLILGDSVTWGQGLLPVHKISTIVATQINASPKMLAHSGATIGIGDSNFDVMPSPEVPNSYPTIIEQVDKFIGDQADVQWILMNGGINDVDIRSILNPLYPQKD